MRRRAEFRPFGWIYDLWKRDQLDLSPPYQRRSVWPDGFRADFITTVLLNYPCPAIFLYEEIRPDGSFLYKVVDGKQRLNALFDFASDQLPVSENYPSMGLRGKLFGSLDDEIKLAVWRYAFSVEFIEQENEAVINDIFNRINKNVARLTQQELRHALFSGLFIAAAEELAEKLPNRLPINFPNIAAQSKRQMKDVENIATMLIFIENGERSLSQNDLDKAFRDREEEWVERDNTINSFNDAIDFIKLMLEEPDATIIVSSRIKNQADFYSLFGAVVELQREGQRPTPKDASYRLITWVTQLRLVERGDIAPNESAPEVSYLKAARAASNDAGPRRTRINILKDVLRGG